jgi:DNA polymerase-3 subunit gamma/tau
VTHTALARTYRPKRFAELVGQPHVAAGLASAVVRNRVAHAYLLTGPRGVGKTTAARILAMALNCERRSADSSGEPCGACDSCRRIWLGAANLDVVEIDAASNRGVDDARELRERAMYAASTADRFKVYIVDEAHMLTREAWNALLKILEEPPPRVVFVFATTDPQKIANTAAPVLSRLQRFDFRRLGPPIITARLREVARLEGIDLEEDAARTIAQVARGGMRDALSLLDQVVAFGEGPVTAARVRDALGLVSSEVYGELLDIIAQRRTREVFPFVERLVDAGADLEEMLRGAGEVLRHLFFMILGGTPDGLPDDLRQVLERHRSGFKEGDLLRMLKLLTETEAALPRSPNARLLVEMLVLEWTLLDRTVELAEVLAAVRAGRTGTPDNPGPSRAGAPARAESVPTPAAPPPPPRPAPGTPALETLRDAWPTVLDAVGRQRRMAREALTQAALVAFEGGQVVLEVTDAVQLEGLERSRVIVRDAISQVLGGRVDVVFRGPASEVAEKPRGDARRLDRKGDREERLRSYRAQDPSLDAMTEALDLELLE